MATIPEALQVAQEYLRSGHLPQTEEVCRRILQVDPSNTNALWFLGLAAQTQGKYSEAIVSYQQALRLNPNLAEVHNNLANAYRELGRPEEALSSFEQALRLKHDYPHAHMNYGITLLLLGRLEQGWREYEWRWKSRDMALPLMRQPLWDGAPLAGRTILLHLEQGLGDTIQFIRFAPLVKQRGGTVIVQCQKPLIRLLASCPGIDRLVAAGEPLPPFDVQAPLLHLPGILGTTLDSIPAPVPYLRADSRLVERWRQELASVRALKVGIAWQGNPDHPGDRDRSFPLAHFLPLTEENGVQLFSLQIGAGSEQLQGLVSRLAVIDLVSRIGGDFLETAATVSSLDLIISVDSALAHLAGALGVPVWVPLPFAPDWRWLLGREDSPWYPTMRLFRQPEPGNWSAVFERMRAALRNRP